MTRVHNGAVYQPGGQAAEGVSYRDDQAPLIRSMLLAALILLLMIVSAGCSATGMDIETKGNTTTVTTKDGTTLTSTDEDGKLPDGLPFPAYPKAKVIAGNTSELYGLKHWTGSLETKGGKKEIEKIAAFYEEAIRDLGTVNRTETDEDGIYQIMLQIESKTHSGVVDISNWDEEAIVIDLSWQEKGDH